ncbi:MAG: C10 family peptidase, partial [Bacteroidales bacterium]|nr:C10 family peptidase [Bacteroidales bacterium]
KDLLPEDVNIAPVQEEISANTGDETFVSSEQALEIAGKFLSSDSGAETRALENVSVEAIKDEENGGNPAMYVVNYPEGGWAIVSATRNYFPVLAHSDKGSFNLENISESGVSVWIAETKEAMRLCKDLADSVKVQINTQWLTYEEAMMKISSVPQTRNWNDFSNRIAQLEQLYPNQWSYTNLYDAEYYIDEYTYQNILSECISIGADPQFTIVGIKTSSTYTAKGPLMTTKWHQSSPFNNLCNTCPAGCAPISIAQILRYHERPANFILDGVQIDWDSMLDYSATLSTQKLIEQLGAAMGITYGFNCNSGANDNNITNALSVYVALGYNYILQNHNINMVTANINANKPVSMGGYTKKTLGIPHGDAHQWVCDGLKKWTTDTEFFVEYYNQGYYSSSGYAHYNPGISIIDISNFHMNWGWGGTNDGWFTDNSFPSGHNYLYGRTNFHITAPI